MIRLVERKNKLLCLPDAFVWWFHLWIITIVQSVNSCSYWQCARVHCYTNQITSWQLSTQQISTTHTERERESTLYWPHWPNYCMYECSFLRLSFVQFNFYLSTRARTNDIDDGNSFIYFLLLSIPNSTNIYLACVNIDFDWSWYKGIN